MKSVLLSLALGLFMASSVALAMAEPPEPPEALRGELQLNGHSVPVEAVRETPLPGIYEVRLQGGNTLYADAKGDYLLAGDLYHNAESGMVNLTEQAANDRRVTQLAEIPASERIIFKPAGEVRAKVTVFTDASCPYCQKFHQEVPRLNRMGIEVDYLAFPRMGLKSEGARVLRQAWCAENPSEAVTAAMRGETLQAAADCDNPVDEHYALGLATGIQGTPAIVLPDGQMVPGYVPAERLATMLGLED
ncbi:bifunctional protein-disulfide isomerase/oxidoreductase DsbC [Halomonas shantousis]